jgi:hypothetical protein
VSELVRTGTWVAYTPTWTSTSNPSLGNGAITGEYSRSGPWVCVRVGLTWGSTTTGGSGGWAFTLPLPSVYDSTHNPYPIWHGSAIARDVSATTYYTLTAYADSTTNNCGAFYGTSGAASATVPFTWATSDFFGLTLNYRTSA